MSRLALPLIVAIALPFVVACSSPPTQEELESDSLVSSNGANMRKGAPADAGSCRLPLTSGVPVCDQCLQARCCTAFAACSANQQCASLDGCLARCNQTVTSQAQGQACYNACTQQFPQGAQLWLNADQCMGSCAQYCPR